MKTDTPKTACTPPRASKQCVRIYVLKNPADRKRGRAVSKKDKDFTCVYVKDTVLAELLALAEGDMERVRSACKIASVVERKREGVTWTATVLTGARRLLAAEKVERDSARENNAKWEDDGEVGV